MKTQRRMASPWQQDAIDRISPLMSELVANMNAAITHLNNNKSRPTAPPYLDYLKTNTRLATDLSDMMSELIDYAEAKPKFDSLNQQLDSSEH